MKLALCFLTYENVSQPKLWYQMIHPNQHLVNVYIHNKHPFTDEYGLHTYCIPTIQTKYAHKSILEATLLLFKHALQDTENECFMLLSDTCIPLFSMETIHAKLSVHSSMTNYDSDCCSTRVRHVEPFFETFKKQSQWLMLNRSTAQFFVDHSFTHLYKDSFPAPDEHYFNNLCDKFNLPYVNKRLTYVNWHPSDPPHRLHPKTYDVLTNEMIESIQKMFVCKEGESYLYST